ncbi:MAG: hypothetical protein MRJ68_18895 [Nitrospira sp.]|nr:hypothetical protein [Nitrospira sp.]
MTRVPPRKTSVSKPSNPTPYPYTIPQVICPDAATVKKLDPWFVLEFFRIEALLRSKTVMNLHRTTFHSWNIKDNNTDTFMAAYKVVGGWRALDREHQTFFLHQNHPELRQMEEEAAEDEAWYQSGIAPGILNLREVIRHQYEHFQWNILGPLRKPKDHGLERPPRALWVALDPARSPSALLKGLRPFLEQAHKPYKRAQGGLADPFLEVSWGWPTHWEPYRHPRKPPPIYGFKGIKTWLDYFRCYDLRVTQALSFGQIAQRVYGKNTPQTYERAEQGCKRVRQLIKYAEQKQWPPPPIR